MISSQQNIIRVWLLDALQEEEIVIAVESLSVSYLPDIQE